MLLYIVRHGETAGNVSQLIQGITNSQLNARGRKQALALGRGLRASGLMIDRVVASDLLRAQETAQQILLGMQVKLAIETDKGLREENDGVFEGRSLKDVSQEVLVFRIITFLCAAVKCRWKRFLMGYTQLMQLIKLRIRNKWFLGMILPCAEL